MLFAIPPTNPTRTSAHPLAIRPDLDHGDETVAEGLCDPSSAIEKDRLVGYLGAGVCAAALMMRAESLASTAGSSIR
jgi:hypothetical protein